MVQYDVVCSKTRSFICKTKAARSAYPMSVDPVFHTSCIHFHLEACYRVLQHVS